MDPVHVHLIVNHLPVLGSLIGFLVLLYAWITGSRETKIAAAVILLAAGIGGLVANASGEEAEDRVETIAGVNEAGIEAHEEAAETAMPFLIVTVIASLALWAGEWLRRGFARYALWALAVASAGTVITASYTAWLGGKIRHTEISGTAAPAGGANEAEEEEYE